MRRCDSLRWFWSMLLALPVANREETYTNAPAPAAPKGRLRWSACWSWIASNMCAAGRPCHATEHTRETQTVGSAAAPRGMNGAMVALERRHCSAGDPTASRPMVMSRYQRATRDRIAAGHQLTRCHRRATVPAGTSPYNVTGQSLAFMLLEINRGHHRQPTGGTVG